MNQPDAIQHDTLGTRIETIVRSIASGDNACGSLMDGKGCLNLDFLRSSVKPTLAVYEFEADALRADKMALSRESEERCRLKFLRCAVYCSFALHW